MLHEHGVPHEAIEPGIDDGGLRPGRVSPPAWAAALANLKACAGAESLRLAGCATGALVLGADTICVMDGKLFGQARDADEARATLAAFDDREHEVITGVALVDAQTGQREMFADRAVVRWGEVGTKRIDEYVRSGAWRGKAGAYNLVERIGAGWPITHEGDWTTVVGLPMRRLMPRVRTLLVASAPAHAPIAPGLRDGMNSAMPPVPSGCLPGLTAWAGVGAGAGG